MPNIDFEDEDITYSYDLQGRLTKAAKNAANQTVFTWDALGRKTGESNYYYALTSQYDLAGRRTRLTWQDGFYAQYDYLITGEVSAVRENGAASGVGVLATYGYDDLGRRTSLTRGNGVVTSYAYDGVSRLASLVQDLAGTGSDVTTSFAYNPAAQITTRTRSNPAYAWTGAYNVDRPYTANGLNQLTTAGSGAGGLALGYDGRGNLTSSGAATYGYTSQNRLHLAPGGVDLRGDALDRLDYISTNTVQFAHDGADMVTESTYNGGFGPILRRYVRGPGTDEPLVWYEGSGTADRRWLVQDERGSVVAVTNDTGSAMAINSYDAFGIPAASNLGRFQYTGQAWIPEIGMYDYKARTYSATLGRFLQTDPIGYSDGMNIYAYVGNDPVNGIDPSGLCEAGTKGGNNCVLPVDGGEIVVTGRPYSGQRPLSEVLAIGDAIARLSRETFGGNEKNEPQKEKTTFEKFKNCASSQLGIDDLVEAGGAIGAGLNILPTRGKFGGATQGTSIASKAASSVFGKARIPFGLELPSVVGFPLVGEGLAIRATTSLARFSGRAVPVVGWALLAYDAASIAVCTASDE